MTDRETAEQMLLEDVDKAINRIEQAAAPAECKAHDSLAQGLTVLLRIQKHQLSNPPNGASKIAVGVISTVIAAVVAILKEVFWHQNS